MALRKRHLRALGGVMAFGLAAGVAVACGDAFDDSAFEPATNIDGGAPDANGGFGDAAPPSLPADGLVIVHAASLPAFRLCFDAHRSRQPVPSDQLMPSSNIAGVEIGSVVRIDPLPNVIGRVWAFPEPAIRALYPPGQAGPTCAVLLESLSDAAIELGEIERDLSTGVHLLVVSGCRAASIDPTASVDTCGPSWTAETGNVALRVIDVDAYHRTTTTSLPVQVVQLSNALASRTEGRRISIGLGELDASPAPFITDHLAFGDVVPDTPMQVTYEPSDTASFASVGFHVSVEAPEVADGGDAGEELLLRQSLADVALLSSTRELPPQWFAAASSYVLLLVGDLEPEDASSDDRRRIHLLAVPLAAPQVDEPDAEAFDAGSLN